MTTNAATGTAAKTSQALAALVLALLFSLAASAQTTTPTDGQTPLGLTPGAPEGSYALGGFDSVNLYNGNLNLRLPLLKIGGRGAAQMTMTLPIDIQYRILQVHFPGIPPNPPTDTFIPAGGHWWPLPVNYGPGILVGRQAGSTKDCGSPVGQTIAYTLTRLTFVSPDGSEYELRDQQTQGKPTDYSSTACGASIPTFDRGRVFYSADGTSMTFVSDTDISDVPAAASSSQFYFPYGYLYLRDGTRFRIQGGLVQWLSDRNGNQLTFAYDSLKRVTSITDPLNRVVTVTYGDPINGPLYDEIDWKGCRGTPRSIRVLLGYLHNALRGGAAQGSSAYSLQTVAACFPYVSSDTTLNDTFVTTGVQLPDGRQYRFFYNNYAELARVELPTGGAYEYDHSPLGVGGVGTQNNGFQVYRRTTERRVYADGVTLENRTTYADSEITGGVVTNLLVDETQTDGGGGLLAHAKHYFNGTPIRSFNQEAVEYAGYLESKEYLTENYDNNGSLLRSGGPQYTQRTSMPWWTSWTGPGGDQSAVHEPPNDVQVLEADTTLTDVTPNLFTKQTFRYDAFNNKTDTWEYDFAPNAPPAQPLRHTKTVFLTTNQVNGAGIDYTAFDVNTPSNSIHLRSLPSSQNVYAVNSSGQDILPAASQTTFEYDQFNSSVGHASLTDRPGISNHNASFSMGRPYRGDATAIMRWLDAPTPGWLTTYQQYDIAGNIVVKVDARGKATTIDFTDRFGAPDGEARSNTTPPELASVGQSSYAFPTLVTDALLHTAYTQYDYYISKAVDGEDENGVIDSGFYDDILDRATQLVEAVNSTDKQQTTYTYNDPALTVTTTTDLTSYGDNQVKADAIYDGLGRQKENRHYESTSNYISVQQQYDGMGRVHQVSNPFRPGDTIFWTVTAYDLLGRKMTVTTTGDGAQATIAYSGNTTTSTDQAGRKRAIKKDGLGRLILATEDPSGLGYQTSYAYSSLDNLTSVTQGSQPARTYTYDTLGRLRTAIIPEQVGTTTYTYDENSNLYTRIDPRGIQTTFTYDAINRVLTRTYSDTTPSVTLHYDDPSVPFSKGELTSIVSSVSTYTHDVYGPRGRVKHSTQTTSGQSFPTTSFPMSYGYDLAGHLTTETYPGNSSGQRTVTTAYDAAARTSSVTGTGKPAPYASQMTYTPHGEVASMVLGNGLWEHTTTNSRLQLQEIGLGSVQGGSDKLKLNFDYGSNGNNGNVLSQTITVPGASAIVQSYDYTDGLNRLTTVKEAVNSAVQWTQNYGYDRFGNRTSLTNGGAQGGLLPTNTTPPIDASTNRISGYSYDSAGNVLGDTAGSTFTFDAENRQLTASGAQYSYDGDGLRVTSVVGGVTTVFVYDAFGKLIAEYTSSTQAPPGGGGTSYFTSDHLGSTRMLTDGNGTIKSRHDYMPYGEELAAGLSGRTTAMQYGANDGLRQKFTSKQRDKETGLDYFGARYYASWEARFRSVDPLMASAHPALPETWNRYGYVLDNPLAIIDPNGEGWVTLGTWLVWNDKVESQADADNIYGKDRNGRSRAHFFAYGTIGTMIAGPLRGHLVILGTAGMKFDLGRPKPLPIKEIEWYGGDGERFLLAYFKFALENAVCGYVGAKAVDAVEALYQLAKARRAGKAALALLKAAKEGEVGGSDGVDLTLKYKKGWSAAQRAEAAAKAQILNDSETVVTDAERAGTSAASRYRQAGGNIPPGNDVDHVIDLQLGGADSVPNMSPLDASVNRSLGSQIHHRIKNLPVGTRVNRVTIR